MFKFKKQQQTMDFNYNYPKLAREAGFRLRQYKDGPLDWRLLGSFEIERLMRDQNLEEIDKALVHLSEAPLGSALIDTNILDSGIAKYFIVSQFGIQYLLFCRNFLDETVQELRDSHTESQFEIARMKKLLSEANNEILQMHKKMTQMEAIHEVIYPCHLCTKNFANNEALNIHIGRKHGGSNNDTINRNKAATPPKERAKDLTLINTIKLELEIKQLKERLNTAEKEIKARGVNSMLNSSKNTTPHDVERRHVAIQSNLSEEKEKDETRDDTVGDGVEVVQSEDIAERQKQLEKLQSKIYDIEEWRATQLINNEESISEIKRRLSDIALVLERTTTAAKPTETSASISEVYVSETLERRLSVENLERVLSEKVAEIGKASTEKLAQIAHNMEMNYRDKLFELEREVKAAIYNQNISNIKQVEAAAIEASNKPVEVQPAPRLKRASAAIVSAFEDEIMQITKSDDDEGEGTYNIELNATKASAIVVNTKMIETKAAPPPTTSLTTESNRTFVKVVEHGTKTPIQQISKNLLESSSDTTDISESLSVDETSEDKIKMIAKPRSESALKEQQEPTKKVVREKVSKIKRPKSPKKLTRKDAKNLAAKRLEKYGFDMRMKSLPSSTLKRVSNELQEKRNKMRQTYPNYYPTRSRIRKFVDKLCSRKLPEKAEIMLKTKTALQPHKVLEQNEEEQTTSKESVESTDDDDDVDDDDEQSDNDNVTKITNEAQPTKEDFKKRLELLLASPIKRPLGMDAPSTSKAGFIKANLNDERPLILKKPMPVPRKRVMFDTVASGQK